jgi:two-component system CheB/CheR fusion protein
MGVRQPPGPTVVVVDDDRDTLDVLALGLGRCGAVVSTYADAEHAVAALQWTSPDALLTDLTLSPRDGFWLMAQVRANPRLAHLPIVVLTGHGEGAYLEAARRSGADDVLVKPVDTRVIYNRIVRLIPS